MPMLAAQHRIQYPFLRGIPVPVLTFVICFTTLLIGLFGHDIPFLGFLERTG